MASPIGPSPTRRSTIAITRPPAAPAIAPARRNRDTATPQRSCSLSRCGPIRAATRQRTGGSVTGHAEEMARVVEELVEPLGVVRQQGAVLDRDRVDGQDPERHDQ